MLQSASTPFSLLAGSFRLFWCREERQRNGNASLFNVLLPQPRKLVTPKHPPHFARKLVSHRYDRFGRFLFVRDAIRFRSGGGLTQAAAATKKEGGAWELLGGLSDEEAVAKAKLLFSERDDPIQGFEVWDRARVVFRHHPDLGNAAEPGVTS